MLSFFKHFERKNELLQKRWVFTEKAPEAITAESLKTLNETQLVMKAQETSRVLADKVRIAEDIVRRLSETKVEAEEAPLISPLKNLLAEIDGAKEAEIKVQGTKLRERARASVENMMQKGLLFLPSVGGIASAFNTLRTDISSLDLASMANGGWEKLTKSFSNLMYYIKDLLPESLKKYLKDYIPDVAPVTTSEAPTATPEAPETAPEGFNEAEKEKLQKFSSVEMVEPQPAGDEENVYFKFKDNGPEWRMKPDGSGPEVKIEANEWGVGDSTNIVATYLSSHKDIINNLFESQPSTPTPTPLQKRSLTKTLITLQVAESGKPFPRDITTLIKGKWENFYEAKKSTYGSKQALLSALNKNPAKILQEISDLQVPEPVKAPESKPESAPQPTSEKTVEAAPASSSTEKEQVAQPKEVAF
jgi:hypothetical protein